MKKKSHSNSSPTNTSLRNLTQMYTLIRPRPIKPSIITFLQDLLLPSYATETCCFQYFLHLFSARSIIIIEKAKTKPPYDYHKYF